MIENPEPQILVRLAMVIIGATVPQSSSISRELPLEEQVARAMELISDLDYRDDTIWITFDSIADPHHPPTDEGEPNFIRHYRE
jgi:hypothetical protein